MKRIIITVSDRNTGRPIGRGEFDLGQLAEWVLNRESQISVVCDDPTTPPDFPFGVRVDIAHATEATEATEKIEVVGP